MNTPVNLEIKNRIATITLNRPEVRNAINIEMIDALHNALNAIENDKDIRSAIITGAGGIFCAGGDLDHPLFTLETPEERGPVIENIYNIPGRIHKMAIPFIAAINGPAIGGGVTLASFCDLRIAAESAVFILNYVGIGVLPDFGGCYFLPRILGTGKAMELAMLGDKFDAGEAQRIGMVYSVVPDIDLHDEALRIAGRLASLPPLALKIIKKAIYELPNKSMEEALYTEAGYFNYLLGTEDCREGARAFREKRDAEFHGH